MASIAQAIMSLRPGETWEMENCDYSKLIWHHDTTPPTLEELETEAARLTEIEIATAYKAKRAAEYPPVADYLDGIVKGDEAQQAAYIAACQAVKAKYPKP
jgi:hypothetical protein